MHTSWSAPPPLASNWLRVILLHLLSLITGLQGTNAHAIIQSIELDSRASGDGGLMATDSLAAQRAPERLWVLPVAHLFAWSADVALTAHRGSHVVVMQSSPLRSARMAPLTEHVVMGRALLPAAAMVRIMLG